MAYGGRLVDDIAEDREEREVNSASLNDGAPLKMISDRLGHGSIAITADIYPVVEEQRQRKESERLEWLS